MTFEAPIANRCLSLDLEVSPSGDRIEQIGAVRGANGGSFRWERRRSSVDLAKALERLDEVAQGAEFLLGHNLIAFDAMWLEKAAPELRLLKLPRIDTLRLNPLAFPKQPYHRLVKHYQDGQLQTGRRNDPEADARIALDLFGDQCTRFAELAKYDGDLMTAWHGLIASKKDEVGFDRVLAVARGRSKPSAADALAALARRLDGQACRTRLTELARSPVEEGWPLAYALAWISVAGSDSVLSPWVLHQFPEAADRIAELRDRACQDSECPWCRDQFESRRALLRWFKFSAFRPEPKGADGAPLQKAIVDAAMAGEHVLGILPTGTGKSICYQLPALARFERRGALTVVISPLVALMADQVTGLEKKGISCAAAITGLLSMPERKAALDRVRLGSVGILLISPEQLRSVAVANVLDQREIGAWVLDEAHCLSKWGPDFRPDYRYVGRFIQKRARGRAPPSILALTATAKRDVVDEIIAYFQQKLGLRLRVFDGGTERTNLEFVVVPTDPERRLAHVEELLREGLLQQENGGAIIYCSTRKRTEEVASALRERGIPAEHFHAGLTPEVKQDLQARFVGGALRVMAATNAFGMGIDKDDVRLIIHADIPGSLENYLQEAGRAGRDQKAARCVLMWNPDDVERQFRMSERSNLSRREIEAILKALVRIDTKRKGGGEIVATSGEILVHDVDGELLRDSATDDTRVRTAISWLEEANLLVREQNRVEVFPSSLRVGSRDEARRRLAARGLAEPYVEQLLRIVSELMDSPAGRGVSTDELMAATGLSTERLRRAMRDLEQCGIASDDTKLTAYVHVGIENSSLARFDRAAAMEGELLEQLTELAPDLGKGDPSSFHVRRATQRLREAGHVHALPELVWRLLRSLSEDGRDEGSGTGSLSLRRFDQEVARVELRRDWKSIRDFSDRRRAGARRLLDHLVECVPQGARGLDQCVDTTFGRLRRSLEEGLFLKAPARDLSKLLDDALLWLHEQEVVRLGKGLTIFRPAMTIRLPAEPRRFRKDDFEQLESHYKEKRAQIHVMAAYARRGLAAITDALRLVHDYFRLARDDFLARWLPIAKAEIERPTTRESWNAIVDQLSPVQRRIVADDRERANVLVLAGPGSGKTRVLVHRIAYLVRVRREDPRGIVALAYNRHAAVEIRRRLAELIGEESYGVTVLTCHALAMRLAGVSAEGARIRPGDDYFADVLRRATELLRGDGAVADDADEQRARLLGGFRWILVDEYQDIGKEQYELIAAFAGRKLDDSDGRLNLFAVGDDDQNIYAFNGASVEFIRRFESDYDAKTEHLVENYRSTARIIEAANSLIAPATQRMKAGRPIAIDRERRATPAGGEWEQIDPVVRGQVQVLPAGSDPCTQAVAVVAELRRLASLRAGWDWSRCAVIAREWRLLEPVRNECERLGVPAQLADEEQPKLFRVREGERFLAWLRGTRAARFEPRRVDEWLLAQGAGAWWDLIRRSVAEYVEEFGGSLGDVPSAASESIGMPVDHFVEWFYEWSRDVRVRPNGLLLLTAHRAKGLEFDHVAVLDGGWDCRRADEDPDAARRLYYVAMTRARATLLLARGGTGSNALSLDAPMGRLPFPFDALAGRRSVAWREGASLPAPTAGLERSVRLVALNEVDLDFAGRCLADDPIHAAIASLATGDPLDFRVMDGRLLLLDRSGRVVGRSSAAFRGLVKQVIGASVGAIVARCPRDVRPEFESRIRCDQWELVVPRITCAPTR